MRELIAVRVLCVWRPHVVSRYRVHPRGRGHCFIPFEAECTLLGEYSIVYPSLCLRFEVSCFLPVVNSASVNISSTSFCLDMFLFLLSQ